MPDESFRMARRGAGRPSTLLPLVAHAASPARGMHGQPVVQAGIVLFDGVQIIDFAAPYEVFGTAGFGVATVSADGGPVTTAMGLKVTPGHAFADAPAFDLLVVPGGEVQDIAGQRKRLSFGTGAMDGAGRFFSGTSCNSVRGGRRSGPRAGTRPDRSGLRCVRAAALRPQ